MKRISQDYDEYFDVMDISDEMKEERVSLAKELEDAFFLFILLFGTWVTENIGSEQFAKSQLREDLAKIVADRIEIDLYMTRYLDKTVSEFVKTTNDHIPKNTIVLNDLLNRFESTENEPNLYVLDDIPNEYWYFTKDRAIAMAENEANSILNYVEYKEATGGSKTKTWVTEKDNNVRQTHQEVDEVTVGIDEYFHVGSSYMLFPHDTVNGRKEETVNCRCTVRY